MANSIKSDDAVIRKAKLEKMVKDAGFDSIFQFTKENNFDMANIYKNLNGTWKMSMKRMFELANALRVPVGRVIELFYPDEYEENMRLS